MSDLDLSKIDLCKFETQDGVLPKGCPEHTSEEAPEYGHLVVPIVVFLGFAILLVILWRKFDFAGKLKRNRKLVAAFFTGYVIWCFSVYAYGELFQVYVNLVGWCTFPPLIVLALYVWFRVFIFREKL